MVHMCEMFFFVLLNRTCFDSKIGICLQGCCISDAARPRPLKRSAALSHFLKAALIVANGVDSVGNAVQELKN